MENANRPCRTLFGGVDMNANDARTSVPVVHEVTKGYFVVYEEFDNWSFLTAEQKSWPIVQLQSTAVTVGGEDMPEFCKILSQFIPSDLAEVDKCSHPLSHHHEVDTSAQHDA